jgi:hypothetical protein
MRTVTDVEAYLGRMNRAYRSAATAAAGGAGSAASETFLVSTGDGYPPVAVRVDPPLVVLRVRIGEVPKDPLPLFARLLQLNARELVHASYGVDAGHILLSSALELENLDFNELEATLDEIDLALAEHVPLLSDLSKK